ncbi:hypothetical protein COLO4_37550 [Corchorus olitorius]|uniref:Uncharacterized protein n=1 Tax=Corchorus olitorius TaxID=93759 RepID=A0A1R3G0S1_9ROSI|nr:hypothetical protein COLO4_37550 [Corchorus olitorius]
MAIAYQEGSQGNTKQQIQVTSDEQMSVAQKNFTITSEAQQPDLF